MRQKRGAAVSLRSRLRNCAANFHAEQRGSVTIQVVFFSLMVFGTTGIVLDSGRVYDAHLQMQAYADQMALAAANELDGSTDSISRATQAVYGFGGASMPFLEKGSVDVGSFSVNSIAFYSSMQPSERPQNDMTEAFPAGAELAFSTEGGVNYIGDPDSAARAATHAVVEIKNVDVSLALVGLTQTIMDLGNSYYGKEEEVVSELGVSTVAAATLEQHPCADLSTLVVCNPWEQVTVDNPFDLEKDDPNYSIPGRSLMYFAPNHAMMPTGADRVVANGQTHNSPMPWSVTSQLFKLQDPISDPGGICSATYLSGLASENIGVVGSDDYLKARDRCLMARAEAQDVCWSDDDPLKIAPVDGDTVVRSINTIFDIWMEPFSSIVQDTTPLYPGSPYSRAAFFQPDTVGATSWETADRHGLASDPNPMMQDGIPDYNIAAPVDDPTTVFDETSTPWVDNFQPDYDTIPKPGWSYILDLIGEGYNHDLCHDKTMQRSITTGSSRADCVAAIPPTLPPAFRAAFELNCGCQVDFAGDFHANNPGTTPTYAQQIWEATYDLDPANPDHQFPSGQIDTWYDYYLLQRQRLLQLTTASNKSRVMRWSDRDAPGMGTLGVFDAVSRYGLATTAEKFTKKNPDDFMDMSQSVALLLPDRERRRIRSAMVNCQTVTDAGLNLSGTFDVPVEEMRVLDLYVPEPAGFFCGPGDVSCSLETSVETRMFVEVIEDVTDEALTKRFTAQLVR